MTWELKFPNGPGIEVFGMTEGAEVLKSWRLKFPNGRGLRFSEWLVEVREAEAIFRRYGGCSTNPPKQIVPK